MHDGSVDREWGWSSDAPSYPQGLGGSRPLASVKGLDGDFGCRLQEVHSHKDKEPPTWSGSKIRSSRHRVMLPDASGSVTVLNLEMTLGFPS